MARKQTTASIVQPVDRKPCGLPPGTIGFTPIVREGKLIEVICGVIGRDGMARRVEEWELHWWELARRYIEGRVGDPDPVRAAHFEIGYASRDKYRADALETDPVKVFQQTKQYLAEQRKKSNQLAVDNPLSREIEQVFGRMVRAWKQRDNTRRTMHDWSGEVATREPGEEG